MSILEIVLLVLCALLVAALVYTVLVIRAFIEANNYLRRRRDGSDRELAKAYEQIGNLKAILAQDGYDIRFL